MSTSTDLMLNISWNTGLVMFYGSMIFSFVVYIFFSFYNKNRFQF